MPQGRQARPTDRRLSTVHVRAYVLVQTDIGRSGPVAAALRTLDGVVSADEVTGPYDVIATVEAADVVRLGREVLGPLQDVAGIARTLTCPVIELD